MSLSKTQSALPAQSWNIPEIISGNWTGKFIKVNVPSLCSKCGAKHSMVFSVVNKTYGKIQRANCLKGCIESYEEIKIYAEKHKNTGKVSKIPTSFFKGQMDPWVPETRIGSGFTSSDGMNCANKKCNQFVPFAAANQSDGKTFICRGCRHPI